MIAPVSKPQRECNATIQRVLPNGMHLVTLDSGDELAVHVSGKMRVRFVRLLPGDRVCVERSPFDATKGRIVHEGDPDRDSRRSPTETDR